MLIRPGVLSDLFSSRAMAGREAQIVPMQHSTAVQSMMFALTPIEYVRCMPLLAGDIRLGFRYRELNEKGTRESICLHVRSAVFVALKP